MNTADSLAASSWEPAAVQGRGRGVFYWALVLYLLVEILRPQDLVPVIQILRPGLLASALLLLLLILYRDKGRLPAPLWGVLALVVWMAANVPFAVNRNWAFQITWQSLLLFSAVLLPIHYFLDNLDKLEGFIRWCLGMFGVVAVIVIKNGGMGAGSWLRDENDVCLALDVALAIGAFLWIGARSAVTRLWLGCLLLLYLVGIVTTLSRGGFIALVAVGAWIAWRSPRRLLFVGLAGLVILVMILTVPATYVDEMRSIPQAAGGGETGGERFYLWELALRMFAARPINGWGPGNFEFTAHQFQGTEQFGMQDAAIMRNVWGKSVHSVYLTIVSELGLIGAGIFLWLVFRTWRLHRALQQRVLEAREYEPAPETVETAHRVQHLSLAIDAAILAYLVGGIFISAFYYPIFWILVALGTALERVSHRLLPAGAEVSGEGGRS